MDKDVEEMQFMGAVGIIKEAIKLVFYHARLLCSLAAILVLPLSFALLAHTLVTDPLVAKISSHERLFELENREGYNSAKTKQELYAEFGRLGLMFLLYFVFVLAFSLLSTAAIVYSVACIYLEKNVAFGKILGVVPRVWKRLMITFLWVFLIMFGYHATFVISVVVLVVLLGKMELVLLVLVIVLAILFLGMQVYLNVIWHVASVITVLEESYGISALKKSLRIVKGKRVVGTILIITYMISTWVIAVMFEGLVMKNEGNKVGRGIVGMVLVIGLSMVNLLGILVQSLFYFSCKSYHHESIDRLALSDHLDAYLGEYVPLKDPIPMETY